MRQKGPEAPRVRAIFLFLLEHPELLSPLDVKQIHKGLKGQGVYAKSSTIYDCYPTINYHAETFLMVRDSLLKKQNDG